MPLFPPQMNCVAYIMLCLLHTDGRDSRFPVCVGMPCLLHRACQNSRFPVCAGTPGHVEYIAMLLFHKMIQLTKQSTDGIFGLLK